MVDGLACFLSQYFFTCPILIPHAMDDDAIEAAEALAGTSGISKLCAGLSAVTESNDEETAEAILDAILRMSSDIKSPEVLQCLRQYQTTVFAKVLEAFLEEVTVIEVLFAVLNKIQMSADPSTSFGSSR